MIKKEYIQTVYLTYGKSRDTSRIMRSIVPNFIHHLDSLLLNKVVTQFRIKNILLFTAHDCFRTEKEYKQFACDAYMKAFNEIILNEKMTV